VINSENSPLIGAKAKVLIKSKCDLRSLAMNLSEGLQLPEFYLKSDMDFPHAITAMCETLGFETWLKSTDIDGVYSFELHSMICEHGEPDNDHMNDISDWFAKIVAISTNLEVSPAACE